MYDSRADLVTQLTAVRAAITKVLSAQAYGTSADITVQRANLKTLQDRERFLLKQIEIIDSTSTGGPFNRVQFENVT